MSKFGNRRWTINVNIIDRKGGFLLQKKGVLLLLSTVFLFALIGCNSKEVVHHSDDYYLKEYKKLIEEEEGYAIHVFLEEDSIPKSVDPLNDLQKYTNFYSLSFHRSEVEGNGQILDYKEAFGEEEYPFFLVISKDEVELQTTSVTEVEEFFKQYGGNFDS